MEDYVADLQLPVAPKVVLLQPGIDNLVPVDSSKHNALVFCLNNTT
jgi:hypothetical protein